MPSIWVKFRTHTGPLALAALLGGGCAGFAIGPEHERNPAKYQPKAKETAEQDKDKAKSRERRLAESERAAEKSYDNDDSSRLAPGQPRSVTLPNW